MRSAPPCLGCPVSELAPPPEELEPPLPDLLSLPPQAATTSASAATTLARSSRSVLLVMQRPFVSGSMPRWCGTYGYDKCKYDKCKYGKCSSSRVTRVQRILQTVAHEVEREHGDQEREAGEGHEPPGLFED